MANITATVKIRGQPLKRAFVERIGWFGLDPAPITLTGETGKFKFDAGLEDRIEVRVHCRNSVMSVLDGQLSLMPVSFVGKVRNGEVLRITKQHDHFEIANTCLDVYDTVWRQFAPYRKSGRDAFPMWTGGTARLSFSHRQRLELSYPDQMFQELAFVEPSALTSGLPFTHIKEKSLDPRLFGDRDEEGKLRDPSLLPHELGHVFHFAALSQDVRSRVQNGYLDWLTSRIGSGDFTHGITKKTIPLVAYVEAAGMFSERFYFFRKRVEPKLIGDELYRAFVIDELSAEPRLAGVLRDTYTPIAQTENLAIVPKIRKGNNVEGALYGALYLQLGRRIGLKQVVEHILKSDATTFDEFRHFMNRRYPAHKDDIESTALNWDL
ncbi:MAG: hypothetical protein ABWX67_07785 [Allosphingosinicella sp.]